MKKQRGYIRPNIKVQKLHLPTLCLSYGLENLLAGICPDPCNPSRSDAKTCGPPEWPAYCLGSNCAC